MLLGPERCGTAAQSAHPRTFHLFILILNFFQIGLQRQKKGKKKPPPRHRGKTQQVR
ncbi:hypothetical protein BDZ94DRAFT_1253909 [Collybia nuda]|uniref:Uncharacterized protein n=1 Tax=Collybia nuda TaxID=64659 RepID=A0A9P5YB47_9AGAR|nr:hypothetical protein BDZ94DRAFT_1253909 [Collybia nuda]